MDELEEVDMESGLDRRTDEDRYRDLADLYDGRRCLEDEQGSLITVAGVEFEEPNEPEETFTTFWRRR